MSIEINGQKYSYDYDSIYTDLAADITDGVLTMDSEIYIIRDQLDCKIPGYHVINDYYYLRTEEDLRPDIFDTEEDLAEKAVLTEQWLKDKPYLIKMKVKDVLSEMQKISAVI